MFDNIITRAVHNYAEVIADLDPEAVARIDAEATLDTEDWLTLGPKASEAMLMGIIDAEAAQTLHGIHSRFNHGATIAERVVFLQAMSELLAQQVGR